MKRSLYNLFVPSLELDTYILYNFLHDSVLVVDNELKDLIEKDELKKINDTTMKDTLKRCGIIVDDDVDERGIYLYKYTKEKFSPTYSLFIVLVTFACNLRCPYCYEDAGEVLRKPMDKNTATKTLEFIKRRSLEDNAGKIVVKLYGGEPLLNPQLCHFLLSELFVWSWENGITIDSIMQSNGTLFDKKIISLLSPYLTAVEITLDGPFDKHNQSRRYKDGRGSYEDIIKNILYLVSSKINIVLRLNVDSPEELSILLDDLTERGLKESPFLSFYTAQISNYSLCEFFTDDELCLDDEIRALGLIPQLRRLIEKKQWQDKYHYYEMTQKQRLVSCNNEKCGRYVIDPFGDLYKCFFWAGHKEYRVGTLRDTAEEWNSAYYEILTRNPLELKECRDCVYLPSCGGGCALRAFMKNKTYHSSYCGSVKKLADKRILLHLKEKYPEKFS